MTRPIQGSPTRSDLASYPPDEPLACGGEPPAIGPATAARVAPRTTAGRPAATPPPAAEMGPVEKVKSSAGALYCARITSRPADEVGYSTGPREKRSCDAQDAPARSERPSAEIKMPQSAGQSAQSLWDATQRAEYKSRITAMSQERTAQIEGLRQLANQAIKENRTGDATRFLEQARQIAQQASEERNLIRAGIQQKMSPMGRATSKALEQPRNWEVLTRKYAEKTGFDLYETIAEKSGTSRPTATLVAGAGAVVSAGGLALGVRAAVRDINRAPLEQKLAVAMHHGAQMAGGVAGSTVGSVITAGVVGALGLSGAGAGLAVLIGGAVGGLSGSTVAGSVVPGAEEEQ